MLNDGNGFDSLLFRPYMDSLFGTEGVLASDFGEGHLD